jgi:hypothetical protein
VIGWVEKERVSGDGCREGGRAGLLQGWRKGKE